jgi:hypothetical protein
MTNNYAQLAVDLTREGFIPDTFDHRDHLGVAWEMLSNHEFIDAVALYTKSIQRLANQSGAADKFNITITLAFMSVVAERMDTNRYESFGAFIADNADLLDKDFLDRWYSSEHLQTETAKRIFLLPSA